MFTGLVQQMCRVTRLWREAEGMRLEIAFDSREEPVQLGDSVALNGCCLTVVEATPDRLQFEAGAETLRRTTLGRLGEGSRVNVEQALRVGDRLGGHYVTGHVDTVGSLVKKEENPPWAHLWFRLPKAFAPQLASKGSIAIDGVSLTLVDVEEDRFSVALIPHTLEVTTLGQLELEDEVNLETDVLAKYVQRQLEAELGCRIVKPSAT